VSNTQLMVKITPEFKAAIEKAARADDLNISKWARKVLADACGYDLSTDSGVDGRGRPKKYASDKERNKARAEAQRVRKAREDAIVAAVMKQEKLQDTAALEAWLVERGISLDDEPVKKAV
jgi:hypothetical protein